MLLPVVKRISQQGFSIVERGLPVNRKLLVSIGDKVAPETLLATGEVSAGQRVIPVASILGIKASDLGQFLKKKVGETILKNEIIAKKEGTFGWGKKVVISSIDGVIASVTESGDLIVKFLPESVKIVSGAHGRITAIKNDAVVIEAFVFKVLGIAGAGKVREGNLKIIATPEEFVLPNAINENCRDKILIGGASIGREALEKCLSFGVKGVVVGGINYADFLSFGVASDVGFTILVTEGFGILPIGEDIFTFLKEKDGYFGLIDGRSATLALPQLTPEKNSALVSNILWREPKVNDNVHILEEQKGKLIGTITSLDPDNFGVDTSEKVNGLGLKTSYAQVKLGQENLEIPLANLELVS